MIYTMIWYIWDNNTLSRPHAFMVQLPTTPYNDMIKSLAIVKVLTSLINLTTHLKHTVATTSVSYCSLNCMDMFLNIISFMLYFS